MSAHAGNCVRAQKLPRTKTGPIYLSEATGACAGPCGAIVPLTKTLPESMCDIYILAGSSEIPMLSSDWARI